MSDYSTMVPITTFGDEIIVQPPQSTREEREVCDRRVDDRLGPRLNHREQFIQRAATGDNVVNDDSLTGNHLGIVCPRLRAVRS
ncbi:MAG: hypothetical protein SXV54_09325 [Chloroflexota bacterium]|nr:hypothetical protein [Chloroflexota bacterium]